MNRYTNLKPIGDGSYGFVCAADDSVRGSECEFLELVYMCSVNGKGRKEGERKDLGRVKI